MAFWSMQNLIDGEGWSREGGGVWGEVIERWDGRVMGTAP